MKVVRAQNCRDVATLLGVYEPRTMPQVKREFLFFCTEHGRRPKVKDGWRAIDAWLVRRGSSLKKLGDTLGVSGGRRTDRSLEEIRGKARAFFDEHGRRPLNEEFNKDNKWLYAHYKSSLQTLCDELGLPESRSGGRTLAGAHAEIVAFFEEHGRRPKVRERAGLERWLRKYAASSIRKVCDEFGYPRSKGGRGRTLDEVYQEVMAFYEEHGRCPSARDLPGLNSWLRHRESSIKRVVEDLGLKLRAAA